MVERLERLVLREIGKWGRISPKKLCINLSERGESFNDVRDTTNRLWSQGEIRLHDQMWQIDDHFTRSVKELKKRKQPITLRTLRAYVGMTDEEGQRVLRLLRRKKLVTFVRAKKCKTCGHVLDKNEGWVWAG